MVLPTGTGYLDQEMGSVLQEGVVPDGQDEVAPPLASKDHIQAPAGVQDLLPGPCGLHGARGDVQGGEGQGDLPQGAALTQEVQRQEAALRVTLDTLLLSWVQPEQPVDVVAVLDVEGDLGAEGGGGVRTGQLYFTRRSNTLKRG